MRITLVGPVYPYRGGIAHYTTQLAFALEREGIETRVISFRRQYLTWLYPGRSDKDPSKQAVQVNADYILDPLYPWTWLQAARCAASSQPNLVLIQWWTTFWAIPMGFFIRTLCRKKMKVAMLIHNVLPHEQKLWDRPLATWALSASQGFIAQTQVQKGLLQSLLPNARVEVCPIPAYTMFSGERYSQAEARHSLDLPIDRPILLFFGIVRPYKGLKYLLEALSKIPEKSRPLLVVAGEFWEDREQYLNHIQRYRLLNDVRIDDRYILNEEIPRFFLAADALIAPYVDSTQSAVTGIALSFGLPMIISDVVAQGINPENLIKTRIFPARDVYAMTNAIRDFVQSPREKHVPIQPSSSEWHGIVDTVQRLAEGSPQAGGDM